MFVCVLSLLLSRLIEGRLTETRRTIGRTAELLSEIKAIPVKSPMAIVYRSETEEGITILNELKIVPPDRILVGAIPKSD